MIVAGRDLDPDTFDPNAELLEEVKDLTLLGMVGIVDPPRPEAKVAIVLGGSASAREYVQRLGRVLRKRGNAQALLYEVIARNTIDERIARRRQPTNR